MLYSIVTIFFWFYSNILLFTKFIYNIYIDLFFMWPPGGGACRFLYRDNNMMQVIICLAQKACLI
jgi:hypothetical protein